MTAGGQAVTGGPGADAARIVSAMPGRVRVKLPRARRTAGEMEGIVAALEASAAFARVHANPSSGSVVVLHDPSADVGEELRRGFRELGIAVVDGPERPLAGGSAAPEQRLLAGAAALNASVARAADGVDLRLLVPLGLAALSLRQAMRGAPGLKEAPWYVLAWYAANSFRALAKTEDEASRREPPGEPVPDVERGPARLPARRTRRRPGEGSV